LGVGCQELDDGLEVGVGFAALGACVKQLSRKDTVFAAGDGVEQSRTAGRLSGSKRLNQFGVVIVRRIYPRADRGRDQMRVRSVSRAGFHSRHLHVAYTSRPTGVGLGVLYARSLNEYIR